LLRFCCIKNEEGVFFSFCLATKGTKGQGLEEPQRHLLASPKFGRVISESSSELPDLTKANLQIQPVSFFKAFGASM
jgi:hypothetical protein